MSEHGRLFSLCMCNDRPTDNVESVSALHLIVAHRRSLLYAYGNKTEASSGIFTRATDLLSLSSNISTWSIKLAGGIGTQSHHPTPSVHKPPARVLFSRHCFWIARRKFPSTSHYGLGVGTETLTIVVGMAPLSETSQTTASIWVGPAGPDSSSSPSRPAMWAGPHWLI